MMKPEEALELAKFLGVEEAESLEKAKEAFQEKYLPQAEVSSKIGKITGSIQNVARTLYEPLGVTLTDDDFKDKKIEDVLRSAKETAKVKFEEYKGEWEKKASANGSAELLKDLEKKLGATEKKLKEEAEARMAASQALETFKIEVENEKKSIKVNTEFDRAFSSVKLDPSVNDLTKRGFRSAFEEKYALDLEESGLVVKDKKTGERIKSTAKAGQFLGLEDILVKEATDAGIIQKNPNAGNPRVPITGAPPANPAANTKTKNVNPRFMGV